MSKITFLEFERLMSYDLNKKSDPCIEIQFDVDGYVDYQDSWMGKMIDKDTKKELYWFGIPGIPLEMLKSHDSNSFETFANAKVFDNKSLKEIWNSVSLISIDATNVEEALTFYLEQP